MARSAKQMMKSRAAKRTTLSVAATLLLKDSRRECEQHQDIAAWHAPSECHASVRPFDPPSVLAECGRTVKWFVRECRRRGISSKWLYQHGLPF